MVSTLEVKKVEKSRISEVDFDNIPFGKIFADHMFVVDYENGEWQEASIMPFGEWSISPACLALHYGQAHFEGMKAYKSEAGEVILFRPEMNARRLNRTSNRLGMPSIPEELYLEALKTLVDLDRAWVPQGNNRSLYIRPFMFANENAVGVKIADKYRFCIFCAPAGAYYGDKINVWIETQYTRAAKGGVGAAKAAGNYAATLYPAHLVKEKGYAQILWTDAETHEYVQEIGTMNAFFMFGDTIVTPDKNGTILEGVTRESVIQLARDAGYTVEERPIHINEIKEAFEKGELNDAFGTGTAASVAPISAFHYDGLDMQVNDDKRISPDLKKKLYGIKTGTVEDEHGWIVKV